MARDYIQPGPSDTSLLYLQNEHRSEAIWIGQVKMFIYLGIFIMNIFLYNSILNEYYEE